MPSIRIEDYLKRGVTHRALPDPTVPIVGPKGDQGASGRDGRNGRDGKDGASGRDGRDGKDGRGLNWRGNWTEEQQYYADDVVNYLGSSYVATQDNKLDYPNRVNNAWDLMAAAGAAGPRGPQGNSATGGSDEGTNPQFTYTGGVLTRVDYDGNVFKTLSYNGNGQLDTVVFSKDGVTTTKTFAYNLDGTLQSVTQT